MVYLQIMVYVQCCKYTLFGVKAKLQQNPAYGTRVTWRTWAPSHLYMTSKSFVGLEQSLQNSKSDFCSTGPVNTITDPSFSRDIGPGSMFCRPCEHVFLFGARFCWTLHLHNIYKVSWQWTLLGKNGLKATSTTTGALKAVSMTKGYMMWLRMGQYWLQLMTRLVPRFCMGGLVDLSCKIGRCGEAMQ